MTATRARVRNVSTARMTDTELARVWAAENGVVGRSGGWLYDATGRPLCHGWQSLAQSLARRDVIRVGVGVDWMRAHRIGQRALLARIVADRSS